MNKLFLQAGSIFGGLAVAFGAFGAHTLKSFLMANNHFEAYETAVRYQFYHALTLILVGILCQWLSTKLIIQAGYAFIAGIVIFSGSLYALCFTGIKALGIITPIGGIMFLIAWLLLFRSFKSI